MTTDEARLLPPLVSVETAGAALGWGKVQAYHHLKHGGWPPEVEVVRPPNARWKVKTATLLRYLGIDLTVRPSSPSVGWASDARGRGGGAY